MCFCISSGGRLINLNNVQYLILDWRNNSKEKGYVKVSERVLVLCS